MTFLSIYNKKQHNIKAKIYQFRQIKRASTYFLKIGGFCIKIHILSKNVGYNEILHLIPQSSDKMIDF